MNRIFGIILLTFLLLASQPQAFAEKSVEKDPDMEEIKLELPEKHFLGRHKQKTQRTHIEKNKTIKPQNKDEDVDIEEIDDELPENNNELQSPPPVKKETKKTRDVESNVESEFSLFENFDLDKDNDNKIDEDTLIGKLINRDIIRTDIPSYLMAPELTFHPQKGPVSKVQFYGAYNGYISSSWGSGDYDTAYDFAVLQFGALGKIRGTKTDFKILVNPRPSSERNYMQNFFADAYLINSSIPHHKIVVGYSRNQVGKEGGSSSYILPFIMRSQISRNFGSTRALGVRLIGNYDLVDYNFAFNSSDRYFHDWFAGPEFTGWVDFKPLGKTDGRYGKLILGGGLNTGKNHTDYTVGSLYLGYKYKKLWTSFEYGIADGYNGVEVVDKKATGFYGTVGYKIHPRLQLIGRFDQFDPNRDVSGDLRREYTAGINYFIKGQALRLILNYIFCQNEHAEDSHRFLIGTQILL